MSKFKENFNEFITGIKEDKKKLFFVIIIPVILIVSILLGVFLGGKESNVIAQSNEPVVEGIIYPVDSTAIKSNRKKTSSEIYKESFWETKIEEDNNIDFLDDKENEVVKWSKPGVKAPAYQYKSPYVDDGPVSTSPTLVNSVPENKEEDISEAPNPSDGLRRRVPSDSYGNLSGNNNGSLANQFLNAVVANDNKLVKSGSYVSIRLGEDVVVDDVKIPRNSIVTGLASFRNERMDIIISNIRVGSAVRQVNWAVYDSDGVKGIMIPENILNNIAKDVADEGIDKGSSFGANIPVVGSVNLNLSKKNRQIEFVLNSGHKIYIKPE